MINDIVSATNTSSLPVDQQILLAIKKRYDLNPEQKEMEFETGGLGVSINNNNDYMEVTAALNGLKSTAGIDCTIEDTYTDSRGRIQHYTLYEAKPCRVKIINQKLFDEATQKVITQQISGNSQVIEHRGLSYNLKSCELRYKNNQAITVSPNKREMKFFLFLYKHKGEVCPFKDIAREVETPEYVDNPELENQDYTEEVSNLRRDLRKLLKSAKMPTAEFDKMIQRVPKLGYKLV